MRDRPTDVHRTIAQRTVGRPLRKTEVVHHRDENKRNNAPANLHVQERGAHTTNHNKTRGLSKLRAALRSFAEKRKVY